MTRAPVPPARIAATAVVPPHAGSGPLTRAQLRSARVRIALEQLAVLVEALEASPPAIRQAAWTALAAVVELQAGLARVLVPAAARGAFRGAVASHSLDHTASTVSPSI